MACSSFRHHSWIQLCLTALTVLLGVQMLRALLPLFVYVLRDNVGWSAVQVGLLALAVFLTAFLAAPLWRWLGPRRSLIITVGGVGLTRLALQLWRLCCPAAAPTIDLALAVAGTILFLLFLPIYLGHIRSEGTAATGRFASALLLGLVLDTALYGAHGTYDLSWRTGMAPALLVLLLVLGQWTLLAITPRTPATPAGSDTTFNVAWPWLAFGPFLFLHLLVFQNVARLATLMGGIAPLAFGWTLLGQLLGIATAIWLMRWPRSRWLAPAMALPFRNVILPPLAALIVGLTGVGAAQRLAERPTAVTLGWQPLWLALPLLLLPLWQLATWHTPAPVAGRGFPVRVMTYNLHNGFDTNGRLGVEAMASVVEAQRPDVLALQEVSRGWVINGSVDMLTWLSQRLDMPYVYGPTADLLWGNAILSRYPILESEAVDLPPDTLLLRRGFIRARIDLGNGQHLDVINTHFHHLGGGGDIRLGQAKAILDFWQGQEKTVIMGDLNAVPGDAEIELLRQAGLADALDLAAVTPGFTHPATSPSRRIDFIWLSPDLSVADVTIPPSTASDHLSIVATINQ